MEASDQLLLDFIELIIVIGHFALITLDLKLFLLHSLQSLDCAILFSLMLLTSLASLHPL